jgi:hypothetical protein
MRAGEAGPIKPRDEGRLLSGVMAMKAMVCEHSIPW